MREDTVAFDSVLDLCHNQHRRIVLGTIAKEQRSLTLEELIDAVLEYNHQTPPAEASEDVRTEIRLSLHHAHLPKLAAGGLITYDSERQLVDPIERSDQVQQTLATILAADPTLEAPIGS